MIGSNGVAGVLLAAGRSSRMVGGNKLLMQVDGEPMVARAARALVEAGVSPIVCVTGRDHELVKAALSSKGCHFVHNPYYHRGIASSLRIGLGSLTHPRAAIVMLGDMPWVLPEDVMELMRAFSDNGPDSICVPVFGGRRGNPVLWPAADFPEIMALEGDRGARQLFDSHATRIVEVPVGTEGVLRDIDHREAYLPFLGSGPPCLH